MWGLVCVCVCARELQQHKIHNAATLLKGNSRRLIKDCEKFFLQKKKQNIFVRQQCRQTKRSAAVVSEGVGGAFLTSRGVVLCFS